MARAFAYCRVSTADQTTDNQLPVLTEYANSKGWEFTLYAENESAWLSGHQRELARLQDERFAGGNLNGPHQILNRGFFTQVN